MRMLIVSAVALVAITACATQSTQPTPEDIAAFVSASGMQKTDRIHYTTDLSSTYLNDYYVILRVDRERDYLIEFNCRCYDVPGLALGAMGPRDESNTLRAGHDRILGCRIGSIYAADTEQVEKLKSLGAAPGKTLN